MSANYPTKGMGELPKGWHLEKLENLAVKIGSGSTPRGGEAVYKASGVPLIRSMNVHFSGFKPDGLVYLDHEEAEKLENVTVQTNDVLLNITGASIGRVTTVPETFSGARVNQHVCIIRPNEALLAPFLAHFLASPEEQARVMNVQVGATRQALTKAVVQNWDVPVAPLTEQQRIVAEIEKQFTRLEAGVAALRRVQANLKRYRASVLKAACEGQLVPMNLKSWRQISLGAVVESMKNGIYKPRSAYADDGVACLRMYNIEQGKIVWKDIKRMKLAKDEVEEYGLLPGDLLVNRVNSRELVGKAAPIPSDLEACVFESKNIRVRLKRAVADSRFIGFAMGVYGRAHFIRNAQQVVGMASISQPQVAALPIPLPPLAEQTRIVAEVERRLSVVEELEAVVSANLKRAVRLRQSILQKAFTGELV